MARIPYAFRRGAIYYWRRRISGLPRPVTLCLATADPALARKLSLILASASATICTANGFARMNQEQAQVFLKETFAAQRERIAMIERVRVGSGEAWEVEKRATRAAAIAFNLLAERGRTACLTETESEELTRQPDGEALLRQVLVSLDTYRALHWSENATQKLRRQIASRFGWEQVPAADIDDGRRLKLKAFAMASGAVAADVGNPLDLSALSLEAVELQNVHQAVEVAPASSPAKAPTMDSTSVGAPIAARATSVEAAACSNILDLLERLVTDREDDDKLTPKTEGQIRQSMTLFHEIVGKDRIEDVVQADVSRFFDAMRSLPVNYRKSPKQKRQPISFFIEAARSMPAEQVGFARGTINRNLDNLSRLIEFARARGHQVDPALDPSKLRMKRKSRARNDRPAFTLDDLQRLFAHPIWSGCRSRMRRNLAGELILKDGLYWVPLVLAYTGARLEEIAGLLATEAIAEHEIPHLQVRPNSNRRLKNEQSARDIPLHPDLIALGLLDHAKAMRKKGEANLFPDLTPNEGTVGATFGGKLDYPFRAAVAAALGADRFKSGKAKTIHSLRHYVVGVLKTSKDVRDRVADDIAGHEGTGEGGRRYGDDAALVVKFAAIKQLPSIVSSLSGESDC